MVTLKRTLFVGLTMLLFINSTASGDDLRTPCGPDNLKGPLRYLIPQGVAGADFRPACRRHDDCYEIYGVDRSECDRRFREAMLCACNQSRRPRLCRFTARLMARVTENNAGEAFAVAQAIAKRQLQW